MANVTKLELQQQLAKQGAELEALRLQVSVLKLENETLRTPRPAIDRDAPRAKRELPPHFIAAREAAMRMGKSVRVSA